MENNGENYDGNGEERYVYSQKAESIVAQCNEKYSWREYGQNHFEIFKMPKINIINAEYEDVS